MQANILEVLDVFGALGIEVTEGQLRIENGFSNAGSRQFWMNPGENLRAPKESVTSEVLNIVSGPEKQITADVLCSENGPSIACSRPHLDLLDLGQGVQSEAVSSDTKGNTNEMKAGGKVNCPLYFPSLLLTAVPLQRILNHFLLCSKNLCSGVGARKELKEFVKQNGVKQYQCTICGKAYLTKNSFGVHVSRRHRGSGRPHDLLNYIVKNEVAAAFDEGSTPGTLPSNSKENPTPGFCLS